MVYVECNADEALVRALGGARRSVRHKNGKGEILRRLRDLDTGIGLMDEDPESHQPGELAFYKRRDTTGSMI